MMVVPRAARAFTSIAQPLSTTEQQLSATQVADMQAQLDDVVARAYVQMHNDPTRPTTFIAAPADPFGRSYVVVARGDQENDNLSDVYTEHDVHATLARTPTLRYAFGMDTPTTVLSRADYGIDLFGPNSSERLEMYFNPIGPVSASGFYSNIKSAPMRLNNLSSGNAKNPLYSSSETTTRDLDGLFGGGAFDAGLVTQADVDAMFVLSRLFVGYFDIDGFNPLHTLSSRITIARGASVTGDGTEFRVRGYPIDPDTLESGPNSSMGYIEAKVMMHWDPNSGLIDNMTMQRTAYTVQNSPQSVIAVHTPADGKQYSRSDGSYIPISNFDKPSDILLVPLGDVLSASSPLRTLRLFQS